MVTPLTADQAYPLPFASHAVVGDRNFQCRIDRLRSGVREKYVIEITGSDTCQLIGRLECPWVAELKRGSVVKRRDLRLNSSDDLRMAVARRAAPESGDAVEDFLGQLRKMQKMGSMRSLLKMVPGMGSEIKDMDLDDGELEQIEGMILSMTPRERTSPALIDASRRRRIARGSGTEPQDVSGLIKNFMQMREMMKAMSGMSMTDRMKFGSQVSRMAATVPRSPVRAARAAYWEMVQAFEVVCPWTFSMASITFRGPVT